MICLVSLVDDIWRDLVQEWIYDDECKSLRLLDSAVCSRTWRPKLLEIFKHTTAIVNRTPTQIGQTLVRWLSKRQFNLEVIHLGLFTDSSSLCFDRTSSNCAKAVTVQASQVMSASKWVDSHFRNSASLHWAICLLRLSSQEMLDFQDVAPKLKITMLEAAAGATTSVHQSATLSFLLMRSGSFSYLQRLHLRVNTEQDVLLFGQFMSCMSTCTPVLSSLRVSFEDFELDDDIDEEEESRLDLAHSVVSSHQYEQLSSLSVSYGLVYTPPELKELTASLISNSPCLRNLEVKISGANKAVICSIIATHVVRPHAPLQELTLMCYHPVSKPLVRDLSTLVPPSGPKKRLRVLRVSPGLLGDQLVQDLMFAVSCDDLVFLKQRSDHNITGRQLVGMSARRLDLCSVTFAHSAWSRLFALQHIQHLALRFERFSSAEIDFATHALRTLDPALISSLRELRVSFTDKARACCDQASRLLEVLLERWRSSLLKVHVDGASTTPAALWRMLDQLPELRYLVLGDMEGESTPVCDGSEGAGAPWPHLRSARLTIRRGQVDVGGGLLQVLRSRAPRLRSLQLLYHASEDDDYTTVSHQMH